MRFSASKNGINASGRLDALPVPMLLSLLEKGAVTGHLDLKCAAQNCRVAMWKGHIVGVECKSHLQQDSPDQALNRQIQKVFDCQTGVFSFISVAQPSPRIVSPGQLPLLILIRRYLSLASSAPLTQRIFEAAFAGDPVLRINLEGFKGLRLLKDKDQNQLDGFLKGARPNADVLSPEARQLLASLWCMGMIDATPPAPAQECFQRLAAYMADPQISQAPPRDMDDPLPRIEPEKPYQGPAQSEPKAEPAENAAFVPDIPSACQAALDTPKAIDALLGMMERWHASDLFLGQDKIPALRIHGQVLRLNLNPISREAFQTFMGNAVAPTKRRLFDETGDLDFGYSLDAEHRFRINFYREQNRIALVARAIPVGEFSFDDLKLPESVRDLASQPRGLILVTGATGSGKSTTLAAMIHFVNTSRQAHIVTIEDPIEFIHRDHLSRISQREVGTDTGSFHSALRHVVRESPDVIMIGEMRDTETVSVAMSAALTGHLVLASMHTIEAVQTLQRILSYYPQDIRHQISMELSLSLKGIISQRLLPSASGEGREPAVEVLTATPAVSRLLREQRIDELGDFLRHSQDPEIRSFDRSILELYRKKRITYEVGKAYATNSDEFAMAAQGMETGSDAFNAGGTGRFLTGLDIRSLLGAVLERKASDLHLTEGRPPTLRINGRMEPLPTLPLTEADMRILLFPLLSVRQRSTYQLEREIDFALALDGGHRFRINAYYQKGKMAAAFRVIPALPPSPEALHIHDGALKLAEHSQGLLLVVGPTGSGKSTTMACMVDRVNRSRACRIITVEDPIEFTHASNKATIDQREVGADTHNFAAALKYILRQDPDVIMIGEMRDLETISAAITVAETGHLVLASLHTNNAVQTIDRMIDVFPPHQQPQVRAQLAASLLGVISQRLLPLKNAAGRIPAFEIMIATPAIRNMIRDDKMHQAQSILETSFNMGMITMDRSLQKLYRTGLVTREAALLHASGPGAVDGEQPGGSEGF